MDIPQSRMGTSRAGGRPMTASRPMTSARPITTTGLVAPKSSRGRTGLRRQVMDKTYWIGVIKAKMNELTAEIASLSKDCDAMSKDEARMGVWQKKAESLARELAGLSGELATFNEFNDRIRVGDSHDEIQEEMEELKKENEALSMKLDVNYEEKKRREEQIIESEQEIEQIQRNWENLRRQFTPEQHAQFQELERVNKDLTAKCERLEDSIQSWTQKRVQLENASHSGSDSFLRKEILQALERLRDLEKQRDDLVGQSSNTDERGRLLAQVKRDNKEISSMEARIAEVDQECVNITTELEAYEDTEATEKYRDLRQKEITMDAFLGDYEATKEEEMEKLRAMGADINEVLSRINRAISHIDGLKISENDAEANKAGFDGLLDEKRKLELDLNKIEHLESKINIELETLRTKIKTVEADIVTYSDIPKLKHDIEDKTEKLKEERDRLRDRISELKNVNRVSKEKLDGKKEDLASNEVYAKIKALEGKLSEVLASNHKLEAQVTASDNTHLKKVVLEQVKKYNQKLQGY